MKSMVWTALAAVLASFSLMIFTPDDDTSRTTYCTDRMAASMVNEAPEEQRGEEYRKYLKTSVRLRNRGIYGSGTICYYDRDKNTAWIVSCGHVFRGGETTIEVHVFYKNEQKLDRPQIFTGKVICHSPGLGEGGEDISFITFKPDWELDGYAAIAREDTRMQQGQTFFSCGSDGGREPACYLMKAVGMEGRSMVLVENGPRHGRSGGGLMNAEGWLVGICWGSTDPFNGTGKGLFVPLTRLHPYARSNSLQWLLEVGMIQPSLARRIPIINWVGDRKQFPFDHIPLP